MKATGAGKADVQAMPPGVLLYNFDVEGDALKDAHKAALKAQAVPLLRGGGSVGIVGLTSRSGSAAYNKALSERRMNAVLKFLRDNAGQTFKVSQAVGVGEDLAARAGAKDGTEDERFRAVQVFLFRQPVPPPVVDVKTATVEVVAKSFINVIGKRTGTMTGMTAIPNPLPPFVPVPVTRQFALESLAKATDVAFSENPPTAAKDTHYRLFSRCVFTLTWSNGPGGGVILGAVASPLDTDSGKEGPLQTPPLVATPVTLVMSGPGLVTFNWTAKGRPHLAALPSFNVIKPRTSIFIWHTVLGTLNVATGTPVLSGRLLGSRFPSHRVYKDGAPATSPAEVPQGDFSNLWVADPADPTKVA